MQIWKKNPINWIIMINLGSLGIFSSSFPHFPLICLLEAITVLRIIEVQTFIHLIPFKFTSYSKLS